MSASELRQKFLEFFKSKGHVIVASSSLIPDDPTVLLTTAGMQQFKKYYTGEADPVRDFGSENTTSVQKSFRTSDINEVGDDSHLTFFEMLGNFSFGGYFKKEAIEYAYEFITKELGLKIDYVSVFEGDISNDSHHIQADYENTVLPDTESKIIWQSLGVENILNCGRADNFWGPTGKEGPCGPTTEIYINGTEIWNIVFNEYYQFPGGRLEKLKTPGVDTGMGLERLAMVSQNKKNIFETDLFAPFRHYVRNRIDERWVRITLDHARGTIFLLADGVRPSNKDAGYILRRLLRRIFAREREENIPSHIFDSLIHELVYYYGEFYPQLIKNSEIIMAEISKERILFSKALGNGLKEFYSKYPELRVQDGAQGVPYEFHRVKIVNGEDAFFFYQTYGLTPDIMRDLARKGAHDFDEEGFQREFRKHQKLSRAGVEKKFGGHGLILDTGELRAGDEAELKIVTRLHTATHLLNAALHKALGDAVEQKGSDITSERTRFDFLFSRKLTPDEISKIEEMVNGAISKDFPVSIEELPLEEAKKSGALYFSKGRYPQRVKVYTVGKSGETFSKELCGGPHVSRTGEIGKFRIIKEEASSAGVRRIRAVISAQ
uniref:alanine--tRNA ligase n=1 Tax=Candidatus Giovannonibacteria bacterium GW2011_GWF2_42_19 TaxID=1618659 RepID=A0A0G1BPE1_9BACT|nr:MAG: Alanine-tRNA ligase [Candidatus Giovannonibacteria bacterium GW2011_GWF2_42_19]